MESNHCSAACRLPRLALAGMSVVLLGFFTNPAARAQPGTAITPDQLKQFESAAVADPAFKALEHSLAQEDGTKLAVDWDRVNSVDRHFSNRIPDEAAVAQEQSGRCWMFSALNLFRRGVAARLNTDRFEFSENYLSFYDKLEKANVHLNAVIASRQEPYTDRRIEWLMTYGVDDGGNWLGYTELVKKYGLVPKEVMPETFSSSHTASMNAVLNLRLKVAAVKIRAAKSDAEIAGLRRDALQDVYRILALHLGVPPHSFRWRYASKDKTIQPYREYTPQQFRQEMIGDALDDYVALYAIPTLPVDRRFEIDLDKALDDGPNMNFVNCSLETMKSVATKCLVDQHPVWFGCDVNRESIRANGLMMPDIYDYRSLYGMDFHLTRKELFETYTSAPSHNMIFTGVDLVDGQPAKWLVENSWGSAVGHEGYFVMTDPWFDLYVQVVVLPKRYVPAEILQVFQTKAEMLPPWNPMMQYLNSR